MSVRLHREGDVLRLRTTFLRRLLHLFASDRRVEVDRLRRRIIIEERGLWSRRGRREIPFDRVDSIEYDFEARPIPRSSSQGETYRVGVELREPYEVVVLAEFHGMGDTGTGPTPGGGITLGGDPQEASRELVAHLQDILGVDLGFEAPRVGNLEESPYRCTECHRQSPPSLKTCQYCGGPVELIRE